MIDQQMTNNRNKKNYCCIHYKGYEKASTHNDKTEEPGYRLEKILRNLLVTPLSRSRRMMPIAIVHQKNIRKS